MQLTSMEQLHPEKGTLKKQTLKKHLTLFPPDVIILTV